MVYEHLIRGKMSKNLKLLDKDLTLLQEEYYLDNPYGAKGYIDILAIDTMGNYVIIEIKRSNQAARQALHELNKYPMLLKNKIGVKESQIRLILVSTEWHELLLPYSQFHKTCLYQLEGYKIQVTDCGELLRKELVSPVEDFQERKTSKMHLAFYYITKEKALGEVTNICEAIENNGIKDYLVSIIHKKMGNIMYPYWVYVCFLRYSSEYYIDILTNKIKEHNDFESAAEMIEDIYNNELEMNDEEFLVYLEDNIQFYIVNEINYDSLELSSPELVVLNFKQDDEVLEIINNGLYEKDVRLRDKRFYLREITSFSENNINYFASTCTYKSSAQLNELKEKVQNFLFDNAKWSSQILSVIKQFEERKFNLSINIFNPGNLFESIYSFYKLGDPFCLPYYFLFIEDLDDPSKLYIFKGMLSWDGVTNADFFELNYKYYYNDTFQLFLKRFDSEIYNNMIKDLGCSFETDVTIIREDKVEDNYSYIFEELDYIYKRYPARKSILDFFNENQKFLEELYNYIDKSTITI